MEFYCTTSEYERFNYLSEGQISQMTDDVKRTVFIDADMPKDAQIKTITDFVNNHFWGTLYIEYVKDGRSVDSMQVIDKRHDETTDTNDFDVFGDDRELKNVTITQIVEEHLERPLSIDYRDYNLVAFKAYLEIIKEPALFKMIDGDERGYGSTFECTNCHHHIIWYCETKDIDEYEYCPYCGKKNETKKNLIADPIFNDIFDLNTAKCNNCANEKYEGYFCGFNAPICTAYPENDPRRNLMWKDHPIKLSSDECPLFKVKDFWESMSSDAKERLCACCSQQKDIFEIARCFIINKHQEPDEALASALDHLDCNNQFFDLSKDEYNGFLKRLTEFKSNWRP